VARHGKANIRWTPSASGSYDIEVYATLADGTQLYPYDYSFNVSWPLISSAGGRGEDL